MLRAFASKQAQEICSLRPLLEKVRNHRKVGILLGMRGVAKQMRIALSLSLLVWGPERSISNGMLMSCEYANLNWFVTGV